MVTADLDGKPFQLKFIRQSQMTMFANIQCWPALGQVTVVPFDESSISPVVLIESSISFAEQPWEAILWHNSDGNTKWNGLELKLISDPPTFTIDMQGRPKVFRHYLTAEIPRSKESHGFEFTLKYKLIAAKNWSWANESFGVGNGEVIFQTSGLPSRIEDCLDGLSHDFASQAVSDGSKDSYLWSLTKPIDAAGEKATISSDKLGVPTGLKRWFALIRLWTPWLAPRHGKHQFKINESGILCSFLRQDGLHLVLLAVSGLQDVLTVFKHDEKGSVVVHSQNDGKAGHIHVIAALARSFEAGQVSCMSFARKLVNAQEGPLHQVESELNREMNIQANDDRKAQWMQNWYDGLTYCTWNGLGQNLNQQKIFDALETLDRNNVKITNLIIDDNWQSLDNAGKSQFDRGWIRFEANQEGFPNGLRHTVMEIRNRYRNIEHVAVWHALLGYWGGISETGEIAQQYKTRRVHRGEGEAAIIKPGTMLIVDADDVQRMYSDFYQFLQSCQVDSVKTDAQFFLDLLVTPDERSSITKAYQDAWTINSLRYFSIKAISCMSQTPQILFHSQLPTNKPRLMVRNSDDFFPEIPTSHPWHIFVNAYNSLFTSHLNILPDWDMFQTSHEYARFHAIARCVSGGPIYFTDEPGNHDIALIHQMTASNPDGKTIILRPNSTCKTIPSGIYTAYEEERLLKVGVCHSLPGLTISILGIFNVSPRCLSELIILHDFVNLAPNSEYIVRSHTTGEISPPLSSRNPLSLLSLELETKSADILTAYPIFQAMGSKVAPLGLLGKMTAAAALTAFTATVDESLKRLTMAISIKALGVLGIFISDLPRRNIADGFMVLIKGKPIPAHTVTGSSITPCVLHIDVAAAWQEMELHSERNNEIVVHVTMDLDL